MRFKNRIQEFKENVKTYKVVEEIKEHVADNKVAYLCAFSTAGGIVLTMITRRGSKVEVNVSISLNTYETE